MSTNILTKPPDSDRIAEYDMKLMDIDSDQLGIPETEYDARVTMPSSEFTRIVRDLSLLGESVRIEVSKEGVRFTSEGEAANGNVLLKHSEGKIGKVQPKPDPGEGDDEESTQKTKVKEEKDDDVEMDEDQEQEFKPNSDEGEDEREDDDDDDESGTSKKRKKKVSNYLFIPLYRFLVIDPSRQTAPQNRARRREQKSQKRTTTTRS